MKNPRLVAYRVIVQELMKQVTSIECKVINWKENKSANLVATLAARYVMKKERMTLRVRNSLA